MTRDQLQACTKDKLIELARRHHVAGWHGMRKDELVKALGRQARRRPGGTPRSRSVHPVQAAAARNTSGTATPEEDVESSKYDVGVPTKDLSAKVPKDLPAGYGKDRIVVMVRDPYWLHCYWELTRHAIQRAEAALGQEWHTSKPILRLLDVSSHDTTSTSEIAAPRHRHPRRLQQLVHRRQQPARAPSASTSATCPGAAGSTSWPAPTSSPRRGPASATSSTRTGPTSTPRRPTASTPCPAASTRPARSSLELKQLFEERLRRPLGSPAVTSFGSGGLMPGGRTRQVLVPARRRADRLRRHRAERPRHPPGRAGQAAARRHLHDALQPARQPADHPRRRHLARRRRGAHHRPRRRAQHQAARADDPRRTTSETHRW